jgi:hypothetical protein
MNMPPQQPNPEFELEKQKADDESMRAWEELALKKKQVTSQAIRDIAEAEAKEKGNQLDLYQRYMDGLSKTQQGEAQAMQRLAIKEREHQQKLRHQQETQRSMNNGVDQ